MHARLLTLAWLATMFLGVAVPLAAAGDWPHWRGPERDDHTTESSGWEEKRWPPKPAWTAQVGDGSSSPVVAKGRVYALGWAGEQEFVRCLNAADGKVIWEQAYPAPHFGRHSVGDKGLYSGPSSTPEYDPASDLLYTLGSDGDLCCWDALSGSNAGKKVWSRNLYADYKMPIRPKVGRSGQRDYGYTSSPMIQGDWLIVEVGSPSAGCLVAFAKRSGEEVWRSQAKNVAGHNGGPVPMTVDGVPCVAVHHFDGLLVARLDAGREGHTVAEYPWQTEWANNIATPAVLGNSIVLTSGYNHHKIARISVTLAGGAKPVWVVEEASKVCSPVIHDGSVYWVWREFFCLDWETGKQRWKGGRFGDPGSLIVTADHRLLAWTDRGDLRLVETAQRSPDQMNVLATVPRLGGDDAWPHIVLSDARLFLRDRAGRLVCLTLEK